MQIEVLPPPGGSELPLMPGWGGIVNGSGGDGEWVIELLGLGALSFAISLLILRILRGLLGADREDRLSDCFGWIWGGCAVSLFLVGIVWRSGSVASVEASVAFGFGLAVIALLSFILLGPFLAIISTVLTWNHCHGDLHWGAFASTAAAALVGVVQLWIYSFILNPRWPRLPHGLFRRKVKIDQGYLVR